VADQLATPADLASLLQQGLDLSTATLLTECATAVVQDAAGGQRIIEVVADPASIMGTSDSWLDLPQIPVTAVASVVMDGATLVLGTDYKVFGNRLWGRRGWQANLGWAWNSQPGVNYNTWYGPEPSALVVTYTHGYAAGSQQLQLARSAVLSLAKGAYASPSGAISEKIDDYAITYEAIAAQMEASPNLKASLRRAYGRRGGLVRIG
jgi:hypothetical protein